MRSPFTFARPFCLVLAAFAITFAQKGNDRPNVLFIAIDDLNDWVSVFGGHPKAKTPHIERFANQGAMVFQNAHCAGPVCGPSRSAMLSGFMPHRTGIYGNSNNMLESDFVREYATLPEYFSKQGYLALSMGKIYHKHDGPNGRDEGHWAFDIYKQTRGGTPVDERRLTSRIRNVIEGRPGPDSEHTKASGSEFAWGPTTVEKEETKDYLTALWAADQLQIGYDQPFFMAIGISRPHLPFFVPQEFFDLYDPDGEYMPPYREDDLDDILTPSGKRKFRASDDYLWLKQTNQLHNAARAYLAASSYADACLGVIFDGLRRSPHYDNTIVFVWGDHGWHLGEKMKYRKGTGWSESTRIPLLVRTPDMDTRLDCDGAVNMIDFYPTLIDLCGLPARPVLDGRSFSPLLSDPHREWNFPTVTIHGYGNASVVDERWRYIQHKDGTQELYDHANDPQEWNNLARNLSEREEAALKRLTALVPERFAEPISNSKGRYPRVNSLDQTIKANRDLDGLK